MKTDSQIIEIRGENHLIRFDPQKAVIFCRGTLRLYGVKGYEEITELFNKAADMKPKTITLDLRELQFLNSSGINAISKFVIRVRNLKSSAMVVRATDQFPWQKKSLINLKRLMPQLFLEINACGKESGENESD